MKKLIISDLECILICQILENERKAIESKISIIDDNTRDKTSTYLFSTEDALSTLIEQFKDN